jgi:hypothetical protein
MGSLNMFKIFKKKDNKPKQKKFKKTDYRNMKKVVKKMDSMATAMDGLATVEDVKKLREELIVEKKRNQFANLPPRIKLKVLRSLAKERLKK